jgi:hypothetical protein
MVSGINPPGSSTRDPRKLTTVRRVAIEVVIIGFLSYSSLLVREVSDSSQPGSSVLLAIKISFQSLNSRMKLYKY